MSISKAYLAHIDLLAEQAATSEVAFWQLVGWRSAALACGNQVLYFSIDQKITDIHKERDKA